VHGRVLIFNNSRPRREGYSFEQERSRPGPPPIDPPGNAGRFAQIKILKIIQVACEFERAVHQVKLIPPQYVKPFVKTNKNNFNDAEAIC
jgi:transposase